jgi:hypothetical protein
LKNIGQVYPQGQMGDYKVTSENISGLELRKAKISITEKVKTLATAVIFSRTFNFFLKPCFSISIAHPFEKCEKVK